MAKYNEKIKNFIEVPEGIHKMLKFYLKFERT